MYYRHDLARLNQEQQLECEMKKYYVAPYVETPTPPDLSVLEEKGEFADLWDACRHAEYLDKTQPLEDGNEWCVYSYHPGMKHWINITR